MTAPARPSRASEAPPSSTRLRADIEASRRAAGLCTRCGLVPPIDGADICAGDAEAMSGAGGELLREVAGPATASRDVAPSQRHPLDALKDRSQARGRPLTAEEGYAMLAADGTVPR